MTPDAVATLGDRGWETVVETGAGVGARFSDDDYRAAGAKVGSRDDAMTCEIVLCLAPPSPATVAGLNRGTVVVGFLDPLASPATLRDLADRDATAFSIELLPRTTLAQSMDALSSQATAAGYAAVLVAAAESSGFFPMLITAAGTLAPARVLILGVGVAGLQAIATARRLGAVVYAYDIRPETREQVESLGARFVAAPTETFDAGGYARAVSEEVRLEQQAALAGAVAEADVVITTALVPGRAAPRLVTADMVRSMKRGAVIVDMAAAAGGNVELTRPDERVDADGVILLGPTDLPSRVATAASRMLSKNFTALIDHIYGSEAGFDFDDEIVAGTCVVHQGSIREQAT